MMKRRFHIIIDGWGIEKKLLEDPVLVEEVVRELAKICEMSIMYGPIVVKAPEYNPGLSCFTIIDFSHISVHTFTDADEICVDIFSCKDFDYKAAKDFVCEIYQIDPKRFYYKEVDYA